MKISRKFGQMLAVAFLLITFGVEAVLAACVNPPAGLINWWPGDGNTEDIAGSNPGTLVNGATYGAGKVNQAFNLDGLNDYVDVGSGFNLDDMTIDAWIYVDSAENTGERRVVSKDNYLLPGTRKEFSLKSTSVVWAGGKPSFQVLIGGSMDVIGNGASAALTTGWHHLAAVRDTSAGRFELWVDGAMVDSKAPTVIGAIDSDVNTVIGRVSPYPEGGIEHFKGLVDEVEIFNRALSEIEIQAIYNAGSAGKCRPSAGVNTGVNTGKLGSFGLLAILAGLLMVGGSLRTFKKNKIRSS